jgi:hypothetical protein
MNNRFVLSLATLVVVAACTAAAENAAPAQAAAAQPEECPCIATARALGVSGEKMKTFTNMCEDLGRSLDAVDQSDAMKKLAADAKAAKGSNDEKKRKELVAEQFKLYRPAVEDYHKKVKELFGAELWEKFNPKLPPLFKL